MSQQPDGLTARRRFARSYERMSRREDTERFLTPLRREVTAQAHGRVLEIGAGNGLNFALYSPDKVTSVEAIEPDTAMLEYARERAAKASVPIHLIQTPVERLPFADESFESAVSTLVLCSVNDPLRGLREVWRVLKPGGVLLLVEHVRARGALAAAMQDIVTPLTRLFAGNCHWNRPTVQLAIEAGFKIEQRRDLVWSLLPFVVVQAVKEI